MNRRETRNVNNNDEDNSGLWWKLAAGMAGVAALAGGIYYATSSTPDQTESNPRRRRASPEGQLQISRSSSKNERESRSNIPSCLSVMMDSINFQSNSKGISKSSVPTNPVLNNLNALLEDIYVRYIALKREDFELYFGVFSKFFTKLQENMKSVDRYYNKYSSRKQFAGSHFDNLRIKKPDEFDMDIVIGLPLNFSANPSGDSDITLENQSAGYVQLKGGVQYRNLPQRDPEDWLDNRAAFEWLDTRDYILRDKFTDWFKSVVARALNKFPLGNNGRPVVDVNGVVYSIRTEQHGPAVTLIIENHPSGFQLDLDLVPALKFPERRWPVSRGYRAVPLGCSREDFMVVPKPNRAAVQRFGETRSWRIAMHDQEKQLLHNLYNLKPTLRMIKKLRDTLGMKKIASYYIKTIFFHEVLLTRNDLSFWRQSRDVLFKIMVRRLLDCVVKGEILYFWQAENNLIVDVDRGLLAGYASKLRELLTILDQPQNYKFAAKYLLTPLELAEYNNFLYGTRKS